MFCFINCTFYKVHGACHTTSRETKERMSAIKLIKVVASLVHLVASCNH